MSGEPDNNKDLQSVDLGVSIFPRGKKGIYQADYYHQGQHRRNSLKTTNKKVAVQRAKALALQLQNHTAGLAVPVQPAAVIKTTTLNAAREAYVSFKKVSGNQPKGYGKDNGTLKNFNTFAASNGVVRVDQVTLTLIDDFREHRSQQKVRGKLIGQAQNTTTSRCSSDSSSGAQPAR